MLGNSILRCVYRTLVVSLLALTLTGCGQRIRAEVSAVVESGYQAQGQTFALALMPGFAVEDMAAAQAAVETSLLPALQGMGYVLAEAGQVPDVQVRVWWFSTGPHPVYRMVEWRDRRDGRHWRWRHGYRRQAVVVEDEYARYLVVEGISGVKAAGAYVHVQVQKQPAKQALTAVADVPATIPVATIPVATIALPTSSEEMSRAAAFVDEPEVFSTPQEAARSLPAPPARLLWRVRVESRGNLARAERVLPSLLAAAAPFMGKSGLVHVLVHEGELVAAESVAP